MIDTPLPDRLDVDDGTFARSRFTRTLGWSPLAVRVVETCRASSAAIHETVAVADGGRMDEYLVSRAARRK